MEEKRNAAHSYVIVTNDKPEPKDVVILPQMPDNGEPASIGIMRTVGEMIWTDEEAKREFTDSEGRVHSIAEVDPITGKLRLL